MNSFLSALTLATTLVIAAPVALADPDIERKLVAEDGIWLGEHSREIVLKGSPEVASYFKRRKFIANQVIEKELEDGGLIPSARAGRSNQVFPIVRYWIPHVWVISREGLQLELERGRSLAISREDWPHRRRRNRMIAKGET